jgi:hypothetical protein
LLAGAVAIVLISSSAKAEEQAYNIRLFRPSKVGETYRVVANSRHSERVAIFVGEVPVNGNVDDFSVELIATATVSQVSDSGNVTKSTVKIEKLMVSSGSETKALLLPGTVVIVSADRERKRFTINDVDVDRPTEKALRAVLSGAVSTGPTDDEVFGTKEKKKIGDTWQVNRELMAKSLYEKAKMTVSPSDIVGGVTLEGVVKGRPRDYLVISGSINIDKFAAPLPAEFKQQTGQIRLNLSGRFPITEDRDRLSETLQMGAWFSAIGPENSTLRGVFEETRNVELQDPN